jgi:N-acetyl-D-muramate 6-phosphate phosphatase
MLRAVLFDLDGTFADTAPDLALALNRVREEEGLEPLPPEAVRAVASAGARGLLGTGFGLAPGDPRFDELRERFLSHYERCLAVHTRLFDGIDELVAEIERRRLQWGIVTNKAARFTVPVAKALGIDVRAGCLVSGDTTPRFKPAPDPLLHAASCLKVEPNECLYVGDDLRDVQAARAAGMGIVAAAYGYLSGGDPATWGADGIIHAPSELVSFL